MYMYNNNNNITIIMIIFILKRIIKNIFKNGIIKLNFSHYSTSIYYIDIHN